MACSFNWLALSLILGFGFGGSLRSGENAAYMVWSRAADGVNLITSLGFFRLDLLSG